MLTLNFPQDIHDHAVLSTAVGIFWLGVNRENWAATNYRSLIEELPGRFSQGQNRSPQTAGAAVTRSDCAVARVFWPEATRLTVIEIN